MLVLEVVYDILFDVLLQGLNPIEVAHPFTAFDWDLGITTIVDNSNHIPIGLCAICYKALEMLRKHIVPNHNVVEIFSKYHLYIHVLGVEITSYNDHDTLICEPIYITCHNCPINNTFDMIGHNPSMFKIFV